MSAAKTYHMNPSENLSIVKDISENYLTGYIKLYRSIREHWIWEDSDKLKWWMDILLECNHEDKKVPIGFELFECKRGQTLHSRLEWSKRWRVDESTVRRFLALLESDNMIRLENLKKTTRITVCNYGSYNDKRPTKDQPRNPDASQTQYEQECKELKEEYKALAKTKENIHSFIKNKKPPFIEPYKDYWNLFAEKNNLSKVETLTKKRKTSLSARLNESTFDFVRILFRADKSQFLLSNKWFSFDWIIANDEHYVRILEGQYDNNQQPQAPQKQPVYEKLPSRLKPIS